MAQLEGWLVGVRMRRVTREQGLAADAYSWYLGHIMSERKHHNNV